MGDVTYDYNQDEGYYEDGTYYEEGGYDEAYYDESYTDSTYDYTEGGAYAPYDTTEEQPPSSPRIDTSPIGDDQDDKEKNERMRRKAMEEIVSTEDAYLQHLYTLILYYVTPLRNGRFPEISASPKGDVTMLFSTIELIFDGNTELLNDLKEEMKLDEPMIGSIFLKRCDQLMTYYGVYCNHQKEAMDQIQQCITSSQNFRNFIDNCKSKPETNHLGLTEFVVKPFQRLTKYPLLLKVLLNYTPDGHPDRSNIAQALAKVEVEVQAINANKAKNDNLKKMLEINTAVESMPKSFKFLIPSRVFIYEGTLMKISGNHDQERHFILFNDCLMYCKKKSPGKFICRGVIYLNKINIEPVDDVSFKLNRTDKNLTYILYGKGGKEKECWMNEINKLKQRATNPDSMKKTPSTGEAKETVKIYIPDGTFKTVIITQSSLAVEVARDLAKKTKMPDPGPTMAYGICLRHQGKEKILGNEERPYDVIQVEKRQGAKFGDQTMTHFKLILQQNMSNMSPVTFSPVYQNNSAGPVITPVNPPGNSPGNSQRPISPPGPRGTPPSRAPTNGATRPPPARRGPRPPPGGPPPGTPRVTSSPPTPSPISQSVGPNVPKRNTADLSQVPPTRVNPNPKGTLSPPPRRPPQRAPTQGAIPAQNSAPVGTLRPLPTPGNSAYSPPSSGYSAERTVSPPPQRTLSPNPRRPGEEANINLNGPSQANPRATISGRIIPNRPLPPAPM